MESTDTTTQRASNRAIKPRHAAPVLPGLLVPGPAHASMPLDAAEDEHTLAHLERCIAETTFESCEGVVVTDAMLRTLKVNNSFTRITGYSKRDAIGHTCTVLADIQEYLLRERCWNDELIGRKKSGETYTAKLRVKALVNSNDCVTHYIATFNDLSAKKALQKKIAHIGFTDSLTGLKNRSSLLISLQRAIDKCREQQTYAAILLVDIDDFKSHNVQFGHLAGDMLLQQTGRRIGQAMGPTAAVARLFADKFVVVLEDLGSELDDVAVNAQRRAAGVRNCLAEAFDLNGATVNISASMGLCLIGAQDMISTDVLIDRAELVTFNAKQAGGDCAFSFEFGAMEHGT